MQNSSVGVEEFLSPESEMGGREKRGRGVGGREGGDEGEKRERKKREKGREQRR